MLFVVVVVVVLYSFLQMKMEELFFIVFADENGRTVLRCAAHSGTAWVMLETCALYLSMF